MLSLFKRKDKTNISDNQNEKIKFFICCNFSDSSVQEVRRYENTHSETTIGALMNVCQFLLDKYS